jgi:hypothetical protein
MTNANIEYEILAAATTLWNTGVNGDTYKCFLSEGDFDRLLAEFNEPLKVLIFTRFAVEVQDTRTGTSFASGDVHWTYLVPLHLEALATRPT